MTTRHRLERVVDLSRVSRTDGAVVHDRLEPRADRTGVDNGLADGEKVRSESALRSSSVSAARVIGSEGRTMSHLMTSFFTSVRVKARRAKERTGLENGSIDQREQQAERRAVEVFKGAHKNLNEATDDERDHEGEESSEPDGDDCVVGQLCLEGEVAFEGKEGRDSLS